MTRAFVGAEGRAGIVTEATFGLTRKPSAYRWATFAPSGFVNGADLVRRIVQAGLQPVLRLFNGTSARAQFARDDLAAVLVAGMNADRPGVEREWELLMALAQRPDNVSLGPALAEEWWTSSTQGDLSVTVRDTDLLIETFDTSVVWRLLPQMVEDVLGTLRRHAVWAGCRLTHPYPSGAGLQFDFALELTSSDDPARDYAEVWRQTVTGALAAGASVSHHLGLGVRSRSLLVDELGKVGFGAANRLSRALDPAGIFGQSAGT